MHLELFGATLQCEVGIKGFVQILQSFLLHASESAGGRFNLSHCTVAKL